VPYDERSKRATGNAINVTLSILEICGLKGARIILFLGGPCTIGNGTVVDIKLQQTIRSYVDIDQENELSKFVKPA